MRKVGDLSKLHEKYFDLGLRVVAVTDEEVQVVEEDLLRAKKPKYWIACDTEETTWARYREGKGVSIPKTYVIDARGRVVGDEIPDEEQIEKLLEASFRSALLPELHPDLAAARTLHERGAYGEAWKAAHARKSSTDAALAKDAAFLAERIEAHARFLGRIAEASVEKRLPGRAYGLQLVLSRRFAGVESAATAPAKLRELKADPTVKGELGAWRAFETVLERDLDPPGAWKADALRASYEKVAEGNEGTWAAWFANERAKELARP
jgi:hypothetical protein